MSKALETYRERFMQAHPIDPTQKNNIMGSTKLKTIGETKRLYAGKTHNSRLDSEDM